MEETQDASPWDVPPVEATVVAPPDESESKTAIARAPVLPSVAEPRRRRLGLRRRKEPQPVPDPWEEGPAT